jgi:hypothetical protein
MTRSGLLPSLDRPQYPSSPEILLSALAWSVVPRKKEHANTGLIYSRRDSAGTRRVRIEQTMPKADILEQFSTSLAEGGYRTPGATGKLPRYVAESIANALLGVQPTKGVGTPSAAMGLVGALLQDPVGGLGTENPPNFAKLLNTMYRLGGGNRTAGEKWHAAARTHALTHQLHVIEKALASTTLRPYLEDGWDASTPVVYDAAMPADAPSWWEKDVLDTKTGTPFSWFTTSWDRLCSDSWTCALPPSRWARWAVCVLRHALGFGYLWESNFFLEVARGIADTSRDPSTVAAWALRPTKPLVPHHSGGVSQMDVMPSMKKLLTTGLACRRVLLEACNEIMAGPSPIPPSLVGLVEALRAKVTPGQLKALNSALGGKADDGSSKNLIETVRYALLARGSDQAPDHSSLLKVISRNYTHVSPGPEWIVVMSGLSGISPSGNMRLGDVRRSLEDLGFKPRIDFLLGELERAGLCASAPDGDDGIEINLGFQQQ